MTIFSKKLGAWPLCPPPGYAYVATVSLHHLPNMPEVNSHMRKYAVSQLEVNLWDSLQCYCYATKGNGRTKRSQVRQRDSADEGVVMSELQAHQYITPE